MNREEELLDLMVEWDEAANEGRELSPVDLAPDDPEMQRLLQSAIEAQFQFRKALLPTQSPDAADVPEGLPVVKGFRITEVLGRGGMGTVYKAYEEQLGRYVAIKMLVAGIASDNQARSRFIREARHAASIRDEHVVTVYAVNESGFAPFIVMELLKGEPLDRWMSRHRATSKQIVRIGWEVALGLKAAHETGLIHRDVKPSNIWLERPSGRVKLLDFGLARSIDGDVHLTGSGVIVGTPAYMAPEQARGKELDHRCDLFSLGAVLYHLATGRRPYLGNDPYSILTSMAVDTPPPVATINSSVPAALSNLIHRLISKKVEDRPQSAAEVADILGKMYREETVVVSPPAIPEPIVSPLSEDATAVWSDIDATEVITPEPKRRRRWRGIATALGFACVVIVSSFLVFREGRAKVAPVLPPDETPIAKSDVPVVSPVAAKPKEIELVPPMARLRPKTIHSLDGLSFENNVPETERFPWQPKELVAVIGSHRQSMWGNVATVRLSPDGKKLLFRSESDETCRIVDVDTWKETFVSNQAIDFMPDSRRLVHLTEAFDPSDPKTLRKALPLEESVEAMISDELAITHFRGSLKVVRFDPGGAECLMQFPSPKAWDISADRQWFSVLTEEGDCVVVRLGKSPVKHTTITGLKGPAIIQQGNGSLLTVREDNTVQVWKLTATGHEVLASLPSKWDSRVAIRLSCDGSLVKQGSVLYSVTGANVRTIATDRSGWMESHHAMILPGNRTIVTWNYGYFYFWDIRENELICRSTSAQLFLNGEDYWQGTLSPDGTSICTRTVTAQNEPQYVTIDLQSMDVQPFLRAQSGAISRAIYSADASKALVNSSLNSWSYKYRLFSTGPKGRIDKVIDDLVTPENLCITDISPDGRLVAGIDRAPAGHEIVVAKLDAGNNVLDVILRAPTGWVESADHLIFGGTGQHLIGVGTLGGDFRQIVTWAITPKGLRKIDTISQRNFGSPSVFLLGKSDYLSVGGAVPDSSVGVVLRKHFSGGKQEPPIPIEKAHYFLDVSPCNRYLCVLTRQRSSSSNEATLYDIVSRKEVRRWDLPGWISRAYFHPDGRHLVLLNSNGTIYILRLHSKGGG